MIQISLSIRPDSCMVYYSVYYARYNVAESLFMAMGDRTNYTLITSGLGCTFHPSMEFRLKAEMTDPITERKYKAGMGELYVLTLGSAHGMGCGVELILVIIKCNGIVLYKQFIG